MIALGPLARFTSSQQIAAPARCDVCGTAIGDTHAHVIELGQPGVQCACHGCAVLFTRGITRYRTIPDRVRIDPAFSITPERWAELGVPVAIAFCYIDSTRSRTIVCYPGPAGVVDASLEPEAWDAVRAATPLARELEHDVEALLVRGGRGASSLACYLVPISTAYELVGRLRVTWQGFSGGERVDAEIATFFAELDARGGRG